MRITQKLFISHMAAMLVPIFLLSAIFFINARAALKATELRSLASVAELKVKIIEKAFVEFKDDIEGARNFYNIKLHLPVLIQLREDRSNPSYIKAQEILNTQLATEISINRLFRINLFDADGKIMYSFDGTRNYYQGDAHDAPELPEKLLKGECEQPWLSEIYKYSENFAIMLAIPINDLENNPIGFLTYEVNLESLYQDIHDPIGLGHTGETLIGKREGNSVLFLSALRRSQEAILTKKMPLNDSYAIPMQKAVQGGNGVGVSTDYSGKRVVTAWRYIPSVGWGLVVKIDSDEAFSPIIRLRGQVILILLLASMLAMIIAFFMSKAITDPIHELHKGAEILGRGNLDHKLSIDSSDEIGELAQALGNMAIELKESQERVVKSEKLATIGLLASSVAHELRNPLGVMKNVVYYLNMLKLGETSPDVKDNLNIILQEIDNSDRIISDLLEFGRMKKPVTHPEDINILVKEVLDRIPGLPGIDVSRELEKTMPIIKVDALQMRQVFYNITKNAIDALGKSGKLAVKTASDGEFVNISFTDTGCGIPKENLQKIFEPLFSTKIKGTGLGLSVCTSLVEGHDGKIEVASEIGKGTTVTVKLPIEKG